MNTQMNVRIDDKVKRIGDEVFSKLGLSPSQVVRTVWEFAASNQTDPGVVAAMLGKLSGKMQAPEDPVVLQIRQAACACQKLRDQFGLQSPDHLDELDYRGLREQAAYERLEERDLA